MKTAIYFLDLAKLVLGVTSDYALAKKTGITQASLSNHRKNPHSLADETAIKLAKLINIEPAYMLLCAYHERTNCPAVRAVLEGIVIDLEDIKNFEETSCCVVNTERRKPSENRSRA